MGSTSKLSSLTESHSSIQLVTPSSSNFRQLASATYYAPAPDWDGSDAPLGFAQPKTTEEVSQIVRWARDANVPLSVRVGGHEPWGRSTPADALVVDLKALNSIKVISELESPAATDIKPVGVVAIGGGVLGGDLVSKLAEQGYMVPCAAAESVGHTSWACLGGYSNMMGALGAGVDQIEGAKVVLADGEVVDVGKDHELLFGIRGAGGNFGIIVELRIRVYRLRKLLAGNIIYESKDIRQTLTNFFTGYNKLMDNDVPVGFSGGVLVANIPKLGRSLMFSFIWVSEDRDGAQAYLERWTNISGLTTIINGVAERSPPEWLAMTHRAMPFGVHGGNGSVHVPSTTSPQFLDVVVRNVEKMPTDAESCLLISQYRPSVAMEEDVVGSSFAPREKHFMVLACGVSSDPSKAAEVRQWAETFYTDFRKEDVALPGAYNAFQVPGDEKLRDYFTMEDWSRLLELKRKYDPDTIWVHATPQIRES